MALGKSDGSVVIDTRVDTKGFGKGINTMQKQVSGLDGALKKLGAVIATTFAVTKLVQFGKEAIDLGSDLQEVQNVVDVTFESMSESVNEFAKGAAEAAGLSETMAKRYVGTFGAMAKAFGFAENESFNMSTALTQLAGDVASFYNISQDQAYTKLKSVFTGETETLKDLGVVMTQNALDSFAMAKGYGKTTAAMEENEKVALRYAFVVDKLNAASGDFERTSGGWANQMRVLSLNFDTFKANVGRASINIFTPLLKTINVLVKRLADMSQYFVAFSQLFVGSSQAQKGTESLENIEQGYENVADATEQATKAQKGYIAGLDELNTYSAATSSDDLGSFAFDDAGIVTDATLNDIKESAGLVEELERKFPRLIAIFKEISEKVKSIFSNLSVGDFFAAGENVSELATIIMDSITEALASVNWKKLAENVADFVEGINWAEIIRSALWMKVNIWKIIAEAWVSAFNAAPLETAIISGISVIKWAGVNSAILKSLSSAMTAGIPAIVPIFASALASVNPAMIGELGIWLEKIFDDTFLDPETWTGVGKTIYDGFNMFIDVVIASIIGAFFDSLEIAFVKLFNYDTTRATFREAIENMGSGIGTNIVLGIGQGIAASLYMLIEPIADLFEWTWDAICDVFGIHSPAEEMKPIGRFIVEGIIAGFVGGFTTLKTKLITMINDFIDFINSKLSFSFDGIPWLGVEGGTVQLFTIPKIPMLAKGAVIPPNAPFMAMLGDQRNGTNIEAPADLIRQIVREETAGTREMTDLLRAIAESNQVIAEKDLTIGDRDIARANARGQRAMGYRLVTEG